MYSIIFTLDDIILPDETQSGLREIGCEWIRNIPGMRSVDGRIPYLAYAPSMQIIEQVRMSLESIDHPHIIGIWDTTGQQIQYDFIAYHEHLDDIIERDDMGNIVSSRRPTEEEAHNTQVCTFSGWATREI